MAEVTSVCVFLGSSHGNNPSNGTATVELARELVRREITIVYGGGAVGLMGLLADTALELGGRVVGIIPRNLFGREVGHQGLTELIETDGMHQRKALMSERSDAFIALPGGLGTLEELAEVATWRQIGIYDKPLGLVDVDGFYTHLLGWFDRCVDDGLLSAQNRSLLHAAPTASELLDQLLADFDHAEPKWDT